MTSRRGCSSRNSSCRCSSRPSSSASSSRRRAYSAKSNASSADIGLYSPIFGRNFRIPDLYSELPVIELDDTLPYMPVYCHFFLHEIEPVIRPSTPPILRELRAEFQDIHLTRSPKNKLEYGSSSSPENHLRPNLSNRSRY